MASYFQDEPGDETVMLLGDVPAIRTALGRMLGQVGYRVLEAPDFESASRIAIAHPEINLLLVALSTAEKSDLDFVQWFRTFFPEKKVLVTSGSLWELRYQFGWPAEIAVLNEPFTPAELVQRVRCILE